MSIPLIFLSLFFEASQPDLCKEISVELRSAVEAELISENDYNDLMRGCARWEERERQPK